MRASVPHAAPDRSRSRTLTERLSSPIDTALLVYFRILFGAILLWEVYRHFRHGWIRAFYVRPTVHFTYYGFDWVRPWPGDGMSAHFAVLGVLAALLLVGLWYRISAALLFLGFTYVFLLDQAQYLNHWYLVSLMSFLMIFVPAHRALSLDAWRNPRLHAETVPVWSLWLLRAQLGIVYFYAGLAKVNADWLRGEPLRGWLSSQGDLPLLGGFVAEDWLVLLFAYGSLLFDLLVTPLLLWRRTVVPAIGAAVVFHLLNWRLFGLGIFPWFMIGATLIFLPPEWPRRWLGLRPPQSDLRAPEPAAHPRVRLAFLGCYLAMQALVPLRHYLYPGNVSWTEEGHQFAWHMMLREKQADAEFWAVDPADGRTWKIELWRYVTLRQRQKMSTNPDMILQLSHVIAEDLRRAGHGRIRVHALVRASLNGRPAQWLVDPRVDLAAERRTLRPALWIVPLGDSIHLPYPLADARRRPQSFH